MTDEQRHAKWELGPLESNCQRIDEKGGSIGIAWVPLDLDLDKSTDRARLIAAAPDYDTAARTIVHWWDHEMPAPVPSHVAQAFDLLRAAIAKAEGRDDD